MRSLTNHERAILAEMAAPGLPEDAGEDYDALLTLETLGRVRTVVDSDGEEAWSISALGRLALRVCT